MSSANRREPRRLTTMKKNAMLISITALTVSFLVGAGAVDRRKKNKKK
jgi:hypothetical protein